MICISTDSQQLPRDMFEDERGLFLVQTLPRAMVIEVGVVAGRVNRLIEVGLDSCPRLPLVKAVFILNGVRLAKPYKCTERDAIR